MLGIPDTDDPAVDKTDNIHSPSFGYLLRTYHGQALSLLGPSDTIGGKMTEILAFMDLESSEGEE